MSKSPVDIGPLIEHMKDHGSSLTMNWGEDNSLWEVAWITGGKRFCGFHRFLSFALVAVVVAASEHYGVDVPEVLGDIAAAARFETHRQ